MTASCTWLYVDALRTVRRLMDMRKREVTLRNELGCRGSLLLLLLRRLGRFRPVELVSNTTLSS